MKRFLYIFVLSCVGVLVGCGAVSADMRIVPAVTDIEVFPHSDTYVTVKLVNDTGRTYRVYPMVGEFNSENGTVSISGTPYDSNRFISANIEMQREDFSIAPGASRSLTAKVIVSPHLPPGSYHAVIAFTEQYMDAGAGLHLGPSIPKSFVNVTVRRDIRERLNLNLFRALHRVFVRFPATVSVTVHNGGNVPLIPDVAVRFFDRRDRERGGAGAQSVTVGKDATVEIPVTWEGDHGFGRYRAQADVNYGVANGGQLITASTTFWVLPVWLLVFIAVLMIVLSYGAARFIVRGARKNHETK